MGMVVRRSQGRSGRQLTLLVGALAMMWMLSLWGAPGATAGGPTSALVVSPESQETAGLFYSDKEYGELDRLLGEGPADSEGPPSDGELVEGRVITVTWLLHGIDPWRMDRIHLSADGPSVWVHTSTRPPQWTGTWHQAERAAELRALLKRLGVMGPARDEGTPPHYPGSAETATTDTGTGTGTGGSGESAPPVTGSPSPAAAATDGRGGGGDGWWWVLPGAAAGAVLALLLRPLVVSWSHRPRPEPGPRQELRDV
ncbi:MAG: hypothetical protein H5T76_36775 [Streptomyces sp.]|nr:hypothetical protein [Streptomyces sp.]